jgi:hypothetical protein
VAQDRGRAVERDIRHHTERLARKRNAGRIAVNDLHPAPAATESRNQLRIELDRDNTRAQPHQLRGQPPAARPEIEDEIAPTDAGVADELRRERLRPQEMLTTCAARPARSSCARLGHGPSP